MIQHMHVVHLDEIVKEYLKSSKILVSAQYNNISCMCDNPTCHVYTHPLLVLSLSHTIPLCLFSLPLFSLLLTHTQTTSHYFELIFIAGLKRGESIICQKEDLVICVWQDKRQVYVMSTNCQAMGTSTVRRKQKGGSTTDIPCPPNVVLYNRFMGGVDHHDQFCSYYELRSKSKKFYTYIFWFLLDACIINAFLLMS